MVIRGGSDQASAIHEWRLPTGAENIPIGVISFMKRDYLENFDIGFAFLPVCSGQGYAYEAAKEILSMMRTNPAYETILATTIPDNTNSIKLPEKLGFSFEEEIKAGDLNLCIYSKREEVL